MVNSILTPVTLWKDFDDTLPLCEEIISEEERENCIFREVYFLGRKSLYGRVKVYAHYYMPKGKERFPAVMVLFEAGLPFDEKFVAHFVTLGYGILCVDYCGEMGEGRHTIYPRDLDHANFARAGRAMEYVDFTAKETSWYEWAAVARYAAKYLESKPEVSAFGAIGLRTGGEVLWKITPYAPLSCFIAVCAAGWLAYRDMEKFGDNEKKNFDMERHRFIAGLDSQSYAPRTVCPVLMISAINDKKCNYDRVYDTFQQINPAVEKAILYSSHGNGLIGAHSITDMEMFLDKYLRGRAVYISRPIGFTVIDENEELRVRGNYDVEGDPIECGIFFSEKTDSFRVRDWTRVLGNMREMKDNSVVFPLEVYEGSQKVLVYTFVRYSNGFSTTSKIQEVTLKQPYRNARLKSRILYAGSEGTAGLAGFRRRASSIADCFVEGDRSEVQLLPGYGGILGANTANGIISYRVSEPRFHPDEGASFQFDAYSPQDATLNIVFYMDADEQKGYSCEVQVPAGGRWKNFLLKCTDFKSETGVSLPDFSRAVSVVFLGEGDVIVNNLKWL